MDIKNSIPMIFLEEQKKNCPKFFDSLEKNMKDSNPWRKEGCYLPITTAIRAVMRTHTGRNGHKKSPAAGIQFGIGACYSFFMEKSKIHLYFGL